MTARRTRKPQKPVPKRNIKLPPGITPLSAEKLLKLIKESAKNNVSKEAFLESFKSTPARRIVIDLVRKGEKKEAEEFLNHLLSGLPVVMPLKQEDLVELILDSIKAEKAEAKP